MSEEERGEEWWEDFKYHVPPDDVADTALAMRYFLKVLKEGTPEEIHDLCRVVLEKALSQK